MLEVDWALLFAQVDLRFRELRRAGTLELRQDEQLKEE